MTTNRIEDAIERLAEISSDLNKMIAVHEQRLNQQEKNMESLETVVEKRREESDIKLKDVYDTMRSEDSKILAELNAMRKEAIEQHAKLSEKITIIENKLWMYVGGVAVLIFIISNGGSFFKIFQKFL